MHKLATPPENANPLVAQLGGMLAQAFVVALRHPEVIEALRTTFAPPPAPPTSHVKRGVYARLRGVCQATVTRWVAEGMPTMPVGSTDRIDIAAADAWRLARGRMPTKAKPKAEVDADLDVSSSLASAGLRATGSAE